MSDLFWTGEYSVLITVAAGSSIIVCSIWKSQQHRKPSASSSHSLPSEIPPPPRLLSYLSISSPVFLSGLIRASEKPPRSRAACSDPALVLQPTHIQTEAFKYSPAVATQQEAQWVCIMSFVSAVSTRVRFHYFVKGKRTGINKLQQRGHFLYLPSV